MDIDNRWPQGDTDKMIDASSSFDHVNHQQHVRMQHRRQQELEEMMLAADTCQEKLTASTQKLEQLQSKQTLGVADADFAIAQRVHSHVDV